MRAIDATADGAERLQEGHLRPQALGEFVGQPELRRNLQVFITAARQRGEALDHCLFCGPPGLGKTTLAHLIANELGVQLHSSSGPAIEKKGDLVGLLSNLGERDVLFIDEIHRLNAAVEENLYPAMEDFQCDIIIGEGPHARSMKLPLPPFTLIGATTRTGLLTSPLRDRFGIISRLDYYSAPELKSIAVRSARIMNIEIEDSGADELARRSRGTPRIVNRLLRRVRDFAQVEGSGVIDESIARHALGRLDVDHLGLDSMDRKYLLTVIEKFGGGPVGIDTISAALSEQKDTIEDVYEPYLMQHGLIQRTPRGRMATRAAFQHLGRSFTAAQASLFDDAE